MGRRHQRRKPPLPAMTLPGSDTSAMALAAGKPITTAQLHLTAENLGARKIMEETSVKASKVGKVRRLTIQEQNAVLICLSKVIVVVSEDPKTCYYQQGWDAERVAKEAVPHLHLDNPRTAVESVKYRQRELFGTIVRAPWEQEPNLFEADAYAALKCRVKSLEDAVSMLQSKVTSLRSFVDFEDK